MRQPNWKRWEVILLVDLYYRVSENPSSITGECEALSRFLRSSSLDNALKSKEYRNVKGVLMKYQNIRHIVEGIGLSAYSKLDFEIVKLYQENRAVFNEELKLIKECQ